MAALDQFIIYFNDSVGRIQPNAKMEFYEAGTTTLKNTYTDIDLVNANPWPVVANGAGIFPPIFLETGGYRIIVKDEDDVVIADRDNLNVSETTILSTSDFYFSNIVDLKQGIAINDQSINLQIGQVARTVGSSTETDGGGAEWLIVAGGTGTADDDLFVDLDNGNQAQRVFNQLYANKNLIEIANAGSTAQQESRDNLAPDIAGFTKSLAHYVTSDGDEGVSIPLVGNITESTFTSIGPTGSGAAETWTALDILPAGTRYVELLVDSSVTDNSSPNSVSLNVRFRQTGGGVAVADAIGYTLFLQAGGTTAISLGQDFIIKVPLDSSNRFDAYYEALNESSSSSNLYLVGFGI